MNLDKKKIVIIILIILALGTGLYLYHLRNNESKHGLLILSGRIEGRYVNITPRIQGRITNLNKEEGDRVKKGEILCNIESEQIVARYKALVENLKSSFSSIQISEANLLKARALYEKSKRDYERYSNLLKEELVSKSEFDRVKMNYEAAQAEIEAATKAVAQAKANYEVAQQRLNEARADLNETIIFSPTEGVVLSKPVEVGEVVNPGTVLYVIVDLNKLYVKVYVPEPELGKIKLGLPARIYIDSYPDRFFNGKVTKIYEQAEFTPKNVETKEERVKLVFGVEVSVENPEELLKPGMPADVVIKWKDEAPWIKPK